MAKERPKREIFIKINAYIMIGLAFVFVLIGLLGSVAPWIFFPGANLTKRLLISFFALLIGFLLFFICIGRHQLLMEFLAIEDEVKKIKGEGVKCKITGKEIEK